MTKREEEVLETVNDVLGTTYKALDDVPYDILKRTYIILKIIDTLRGFESTQTFFPRGSMTAWVESIE